MLPMMRDAQVRHLEQTFLETAPRPVNVLEWGCGGSTVHFTRFLRARGIPYRWLSIEHDKEWHDIVTAEVTGDPDTRIAWIPAGATRDEWRTIPMDEYVDFPASANERYDVIIVDGRKRRRCLLAARALLKPGGAVFLHDAQRSWYRCATATYSFSRYVDHELWRGEDRPVGLGERLANSLNRFYFHHVFTRLRSITRMRALRRLLGRADASARAR